MNARERYLETLSFGTPDRIPLQPGGPRESTLAAWRTQGLRDDSPWQEQLHRAIGVTPEPPRCPAIDLGVTVRMMPCFEEKVISHQDGHYIVQDWMGNITEISDEFDYTYIRNAIDFVTRKWHKFPVENRADFAAMKKRYNPHEPGRFPDDFAARCRQLRDRDTITNFHIPGPFWQMREWCGFEPLCMMFIEDPDFIREMVDFWEGYIQRLLAPVLDAGVIDRICVAEDMAYKGASMISPKMTREFLFPTWQRWAESIRQAGVPVLDLDSDGKIDQLIPLWIEAGFTICSPIEVAAGNDICAFSETFGRAMGYTGGVDKRCMAKGGEIIEAELARIAPALRRGGYIPGCDHGVPPDIAWPDFIHYARILAEMTGWLRVAA